MIFIFQWYIKDILTIKHTKKHNDHAIFESKIVSYFQTVNYPDDVLAKVIDFQKRTATLAFQDVEKIIVRLYPFICDIIQLLLSMKTYVNSSLFISLFPVRKKSTSEG